MSFTSHASGERNCTDFQIRTLRLRQAAEPRFEPTLASVEWSAEATRPGRWGLENILQGEARPGQCPPFPERWATSCPLLALGPPCTSSEVATLPALRTPTVAVHTFPLPPRMAQDSHTEKAFLTAQPQSLPGPAVSLPRECVCVCVCVCCFSEARSSDSQPSRDLGCLGC